MKLVLKMQRRDEFGEKNDSLSKQLDCRPCLKQYHDLCWQGDGTNRSGWGGRQQHLPRKGGAAASSGSKALECEQAGRVLEKAVHHCSHYPHAVAPFPLRLESWSQRNGGTSLRHRCCLRSSEQKRDRYKILLDPCRRLFGILNT